MALRGNSEAYRLLPSLCLDYLIDIGIAKQILESGTHFDDVRLLLGHLLHRVEQPDRGDVQAEVQRVYSFIANASSLESFPIDPIFLTIVIFPHDFFGFFLTVARSIVLTYRGRNLQKLGLLQHLIEPLFDFEHVEFLVPSLLVQNVFGIVQMAHLGDVMHRAIVGNEQIFGHDVLELSRVTTLVESIWLKNLLSCHLFILLGIEHLTQVSLLKGGNAFANFELTALTFSLLHKN